MGHLFQDEYWENHFSEYSFRLLWLNEIGKGFGKGKWHFWHIYLGK